MAHGGAEVGHGHSGGHGHGGHHGSYRPGSHHAIDHGHGLAHGSMLVGLEGMHTYAGHVPIGSHGVSGLGHISFADALTAAIVISVVMDHGGGGLNGFQVGPLSEMPGFHGWGGNDASDSDQARWVNYPGVARDHYSATVSRWPHRLCDVHDFIAHKAISMGLTSFNPQEMDGNKVVKKKEVRWITSNEPLGAGADDKSNPPDFWYRNASGWTHRWRRYWQDRPSMNPIWGRPKFETWRTYTSESGVTFYADQSADCQSKVTFSVCTKGMVQNKVWNYDWDQIMKERKACEELCASTNNFLLKHHALPESMKFREDLTPDMLVPPKKP
jgi:hypothetical protein